MKRTFSELSERSGYSRSSSWNSKFHSRSTKFYSWNDANTKKKKKKQFSEQLPGAIPRIGGNPHERFFICPSTLSGFFSRIWRAKEAHRTFSNKTLVGHPGQSPILPTGNPGKIACLPCVLRTVHRTLPLGTRLGNSPLTRGVTGQK